MLKDNASVLLYGLSVLSIGSHATWIWVSMFKRADVSLVSFYTSMATSIGKIRI